MSENFLSIYVQLLERPEILKSHLYDIGSYKQGLGRIYEILFNSFVKDIDNYKYRELASHIHQVPTGGYDEAGTAGS